MRHTKLLATCALALFSVAAAAAASAQESYTSETDSYSIELPSQAWKAGWAAGTLACQAPKRKGTARKASRGENVIELFPRGTP